MSDPLSLLVAVGLLSIGCQLLAYRLRLPAILPLLVSGIAIGPIFQLLQPDALFGELLFPLISLSVAIILFEGALTLKASDLAGHGTMVRNLCSLGTLITWLVAAPAAHFSLGMSWPIAFLFGAIVTVTGPTVIMPLLRTVRPTSRIANILRWEGIIIDPIGALLAVLVYEYIVAAQDALAHTFTTFGLTLLIGLGVGIGAGHSLGLILRSNRIPHYLENTAVLTLMLGAFAGSDLLAHESGLLTVTVMGIWLANMKGVDLEGILEFKETLSVLLISALFILLAARLDITAILHIGWGSIAVLFAIIAIARPLGVLISAIGNNMNWREITLLSWIAPRGIVAAAVSSLFALKLEALGYTEASIIVPMVFLLIIVTVVLQSLTAAPLARLLKLRAQKPNGFLLFGASPFTRLLAKELLEHEIPVVVADTNWHSIRLARMESIPTYYGNPASEHAQRTLDLSAIGRVLVLSPYRQLNPLVTYHFDYALGKESVLGLSINEQDNRASHQLAAAYSSKLCLFAEGMTYARLASLTAKGAIIKTTRLSENYSLDDYWAMNRSRAVPLLAIDPRGKVHIYTTAPGFTPEAEWQIISLMSADSSSLKPTASTEPKSRPAAAKLEAGQLPG